MNTTPEKMSQRKNSLAVAILRYNKFRGKLPDKRILIVEGDEDPIVYSTLFNRLEIRNCDIFFTAYGKDNVLGLRNYISLSKEVLKGGGELFFIDKDFDGTKGRPTGNDVYITPTYSIENILVCKSALRNILLTQFRLSDGEMFDDIERILSIYDELLKQHETALYEANRLIHFVRYKSLSGEKYTSGSISDVCSKFAEVDHKDGSVKQTGAGDELLKLISISKPIDSIEFESLRKSFDSLDPAQEWRGKFLLYIFRKFIFILVEDRNSKSPNFFSKGGGKISLDTSSNSFLVTLSSSCEVPDCLRAFIDNFESATT